jgi:hypothetical protein
VVSRKDLRSVVPRVLAFCDRREGASAGAAAGAPIVGDRGASPSLFLHRAERENRREATGGDALDDDDGA